MSKSPKPKVNRDPAKPGANPWLLAGLLAIFAATLISYIPALRGGYIWDDDAYVTENATLHTASGLRSIWFDLRATPQYYPMTHTSFWIEYRLWGLNPAGYHAVNILLHALNACLLWLVLRRLQVPGAFLAAAIFALHPVQVESVAWITERKNTLSGFFYMLSLLNGIAFFKLTSEPSRLRPRTLYLLSLVFFIAALLSKSVTVSLPAVLVLLLWWKRGRVSWDEVFKLVPFFAAGLAMAGVTVYCELEHVGARGAAWNLSGLERVLIAGRALWFYAGKFLWPRPLTFIYPRWEIRADALLQYAFPVGAACALFLLWRFRRRIGRGPLVAALVFCGTLVPALGFINTYPMQYSFVADHFQYLAAASLMSLFAAGWIRFVGSRTWAIVAAGVLLLLFAVLTWWQSGMYRDGETLWRHTLERNPSAWMAHVNLGKELSARGAGEEAIEHYREALRLWPADAGAHNNLGIELMNRGDLDGAVQHFEKASTLWSNYPEAFYHLGVAHQRRGDWGAAERAFRSAVLSRPAYPAAHNALGITLGQQERLDEAADAFRETLKYAPDYPDAHINLCRVLRMKGRLAEAEEHGMQALRVDPDSAEAHYQVALLRMEGKRMEDARSHLESAVRLNPAFAFAHYQLALVLYQAGDARGAVRAARKARELAPENPAVLNALAWMLATHPDEDLRSSDEALDAAREACRLTEFKHPIYLDTLAAAYARAGDFARAIGTAERAIEAATVAGWTAQADEVRHRLSLYKAGKPFVDESAGR